MLRSSLFVSLCALSLLACSDSVETPLDATLSDAAEDVAVDTAIGDADVVDPGEDGESDSGDGADRDSDDDTTTEDSADDTTSQDTGDDSGTSDADDDAVNPGDTTTDVAPNGTAQLRLLVTTQLPFDRGAPFLGDVSFGASTDPVAAYEFASPTDVFTVPAGDGRLRLSQRPLGAFEGGTVFESEVLELEADADYVAFVSANAGELVFAIERVDTLAPAPGFASYVFFNAREDGGLTDLLTFLTPRTPALVREDIAPAEVFVIDLPAASLDLGADFDSDLTQIDTRFLLDEVADGDGPRIMVMTDAAAGFDYNGTGYESFRNAEPPSQVRYVIANILPGADPLDAYAYQPGRETLWPIGLGLAPGFISSVPIPLNQSAMRLGYSPYDGGEDGLLLETIQNFGGDELGELLVVPWLREDGSYGAAYGSLTTAVPVANTYIYLALGTEVSDPLHAYQRRADGGMVVDDNGLVLLNDRVALIMARRDDNDEIVLLLQPNDGAGPDYLADVSSLTSPGEDLICVALDDGALALRCGTRGRLTTVPLTLVE